MKKEWIGNPVKSTIVEDMLNACKNKDSEGEQRHSRVMSIEDMQKLHNNYLKNCLVIDPACDLNSDKPQLNAEDLKKKITYLLFNALSTLAFIIWMQ